MFIFQTDRPVRYLACVISRFRDVANTTASDEGPSAGVTLHVQANARQVTRARASLTRAMDIFNYYSSIIGDAPYPSFTVAFTERELPGGHSPAFFAVVDQPMSGQASWRNDPVNFDNYPAFFLAHEIAHQWWGQGVGWKNYHEQWLSEGFAQYFAALYAERKFAPAVISNVLRQMRQTAIAQSEKGPVYLGYRLGHIQGDTRVFRAILYNKSAMVLHMLRRLIGDDAFFAGVRTFYTEFKFKKAGTGDLMSVMEKASGRDLSDFFENWIFRETVPSARFSYKTEGSRALLRIEQLNEPAVEFPVRVQLTYASGETDHVLMVAKDRMTETSVDLKGSLRSAAANADHGALVVFR